MGITRMSLRIYTANFKGTGYDVYTFNKERIRLGRSSENDLVMRDGDVSRKHARISLEQDKVFIEDLDSLNGTLLYQNNQWVEVHGKQEILLPAIIILGVNVLIKIEVFSEEHAEYHEGTKIL